MDGLKRRQSLRLRWMRLRARLSIPTLLARADENLVVAVTAAANGGLAILIISLFAWLTGLPLVFPVLGPTAFLLFTSPFAPGAAPRSVIIGHCAAIATGLIVWHAVSFAYGHPVTLDAAQVPTFISGALGLALTCLLLIRLACPHAPACATALIIALGGVTDLFGALTIAVAVVVLTIQAVCINRLVGVRTPLWRPRPEEPLPEHHL